MPYQCPQCCSLFFKTLEIRIHATQRALLYKKRCKRCKHKCLLQRTSLQGTLQPATYPEWQAGRKVSQAVGSLQGVVSEYTARISRSQAPPLEYLNRLERAQTQE